MTATPQLQSYAMIKLFFSATENPDNETLAKVSLYLLGEFGQVLLANREVTISEDNVLSLVENLILRSGVTDDIVSYGLSCLFKLADKTKDRKRITNIIKSFDNSPSYEVQKLGSTEGALDQLNLALPEKVDITNRVAESAARDQARGTTTSPTPAVTNKPKAPTPAPAPVAVPIPQPQTGGGDIFDMMDGHDPVVQPQPAQSVQPVQPPAKPPAPASSFEDIFFSDTRPTAPAVATQPVGTNPFGQPQRPVQPQVGGFGGLELFGGQNAPVAPVNVGLGGFNLLGGPGASTPIQPAVQPVNTGFMGGLNFGINPTPPAQVRPPAQNPGGFDLMGGFSLPTNNQNPVANSGLLGFGGPVATAPTANLGFNLLGPQQPASSAVNFLTGTPVTTGAPSTAAFRAY